MKYIQLELDFKDNESCRTSRAVQALEKDEENHENPMVRLHSIVWNGATCGECWWYREKRCYFRPDAEHSAHWDACGRWNPKDRTPE
jgi:hypothetical protein